jgi:hypothetical protein
LTNKTERPKLLNVISSEITLFSSRGNTIEQDQLCWTFLRNIKLVDLRLSECCFENDVLRYQIDCSKVESFFAVKNVSGHSLVNTINFCPSLKHLILDKGPWMTQDMTYKLNSNILSQLKTLMCLFDDLTMINHFCKKLETMSIGRIPEVSDTKRFLEIIRNNPKLTSVTVGVMNDWTIKPTDTLKTIFEVLPKIQFLNISLRSTTVDFYRYFPTVKYLSISLNQTLINSYIEYTHDKNRQPSLAISLASYGYLNNDVSEILVLFPNDASLHSLSYFWFKGTEPSTVYTFIQRQTNLKVLNLISGDIDVDQEFLDLIGNSKLILELFVNGVKVMAPI